MTNTQRQHGQDSIDLFLEIDSMPMRPGTDSFCTSQAGATLIEVMVSTLLLAIIAIGSTAYLLHARAEVLQGRNQRVALETLNQRLEEVRSASYEDIRPPLLSYDPVYLSASGTNWVHSSTDPGESMDLNGLTVPMQTTVQYLDADGGAASYDYVHIVVRGDTRANQAASVVLETHVAP